MSAEKSMGNTHNETEQPPQFEIIILDVGDYMETFLKGLAEGLKRGGEI